MRTNQTDRNLWSEIYKELHPRFDGIRRSFLRLLKKNPRKTIIGMIVISLVSVTLSFTLCSRTISYYGTIHAVPKGKSKAKKVFKPVIDQAVRSKGIIGSALELQQLLQTRKEIDQLLVKDSLTSADSSKLNALLDAHDSLQLKK